MELSCVSVMLMKVTDIYIIEKHLYYHAAAAILFFKIFFLELHDLNQTPN